MPTEPDRSTRNSALLKSGTLSPNPWDLTLSGQNDWPYSESTRTEDKAPQGCDLSAAAGAGMATGGSEAGAAQNSKPDPLSVSLLPNQIGLDTGVHFSPPPRHPHCDRIWYSSIQGPLQPNPGLCWPSIKEYRC